MVVTRRQDNETELDFYRYGYAYRTGLSNCISVRKTASIGKIKREYHSAEYISYRFDYTRQITLLKIVNV